MIGGRGFSGEHVSCEGLRRPGSQGPNVRRAFVLLDNTPGSDPLPPELGPIANRIESVGRMLAVSTIANLFLMAWKPDF